MAATTAADIWDEQEEIDAHFREIAFTGVFYDKACREWAGYLAGTPTVWARSSVEAAAKLGECVRGKR